MATDKKPRIRKVETIRERQVKSVAKAGKVKRRPIRRVVSVGVSPLRKLSTPAKTVAKPFRWLKWPAKIISLILLPRYVRNSFKELRQVTWPSRRETWKLTFAVIIFASAFGLIVTLTDYGLDKVIRRIVLR